MNALLNVFGSILRVVTLLMVSVSAVYLLYKFQSEEGQNDAFLDEQVANGYAILQSSKEAQWADVASKKTVFKEVFLDNQPVGLNDENPLENALNDLKTAENLIMREKTTVRSSAFWPWSSGHRN